MPSNTNLVGLPMGDIPDSEVLPNPSGEMYLFYEGLDTNLFSESTGINHNSAPKWLQSELGRQLEYLSYLLSIRNKQAIMSNDIVHTDAILDDNVTLPKLHPDIRNILLNLRLENINERNSVQTYDCISLVAGKIRVKVGSIISQAEGFNAQGKKDRIEVLEELDIVSTIGESKTGYLYKVVGGAYEQFETKQAILNLETMTGTKVFLGTFVVDGTGVITSVTPAIPTLFTRAIDEPIFTGNFAQLPSVQGNIDANPRNGQIRFNAETEEYEGYKTGAWGLLGGGQMLGKAVMKAISYNAQVINEDIIIKSGMNAYSVGKVTLANGCKLTIENDAVYKII